MKATKKLVIATMLFMVAMGLYAQNGRRTTVIDDDGQVSVIMVPVTPVVSQQQRNTSLENGEAAAIAAGALRIGDCPPAPCAPASAPAPTVQTHTFQGSAHQSSPTPAQTVPKRPCWVARAFRNVGLFFRVEGGIGSTGAYQPGEYWIANTPAYDAYYYGSDRVFWYGPSYSIGSSYRFVDNYRSGPYPPVRFIPDTPRGQPTPRYQPHPNSGPGFSHKGGGGGRPHR